MPRRVIVFVALILLLSLGAGLFAGINAPAAAQTWVAAAVCMALLGLAAQLIAHKIVGSALGSMALIPYLAAAVLAPGWPAIVSVAVAEVIVQGSRPAELIKRVFNVAQAVLGLALGIAAYNALGGQSLFLDNLSVIAYLALVCTFFVVNTLSVSVAVALAEAKPVLVVWRHITRGAILYDIVASPLPYVFALMYVKAGAFGAVSLALPLLAIRKVFNTTRQLEKTTHELLELMVKAIEARDPYTSGHSQRVAKYSRIIGRIVGLSTRACERLETAALLHDVGKIHEVYAPILRKPGTLSAEEWTIMKTHSIKSADLVQTVSQLNDLVAPIRHHHENWDGTGYPDQIASETIPLWARIIAIADTIDAMTTDRPYRKAMTLTEVHGELALMAGRQFDPEICATLLASAEFDQILTPSSQDRYRLHTPSKPLSRVAG